MCETTNLFLKSISFHTINVQSPHVLVTVQVYGSCTYWLTYAMCGNKSFIIILCIRNEASNFSLACMFLYFQSTHPLENQRKWRDFYVYDNRHCIIMFRSTQYFPLLSLPYVSRTSIKQVHVLRKDANCVGASALQFDGSFSETCRRASNYGPRKVLRTVLGFRIHTRSNSSHKQTL